MKNKKESKTEKINFFFEIKERIYILKEFKDNLPVLLILQYVPTTGY